MSFHFVKSKSVTKNIQRLVTERIEGACGRFDEKRDSMEAIHSVRKDIKKLRAILRLVRTPLGERTYRRETKILREAAAKLAAARDARVKLQMFEKLMEHFKAQLSPKAFAKIRTALASSCRKEGQRFKKKNCAKAVEKALSKINRGLNDVEIGNSWEAFRPGLKTSYGGGQKSYLLLHTEPSAENFHEWRKKIKDLWYHLRLFTPVWPEMIRPMVEQLDELAETLGDVHDLTVLKEQLDGMPVPGTSDKDLETFHALIDARRRKLEIMSLRSGARLYGENPGAFCKRIGRYWEIWRADKAESETTTPLDPNGK